MGAALALTIIAAQGYSTVISFNTPSSPIVTGTTGSVDIVLSDVEDGIDLATFDITFNYNPEVLEFSSYSLVDNSHGEAMDISFGEVSPGTINLASLLVTEFPTENELLFKEAILINTEIQKPATAFTLGTIQFQGLQYGTSKLEFSDVQLCSIYGDPLINPVLQEAGSVQVVPEPSAIMLSLSGILSLLGLGIRRKKMS